VRGRRPGEAVFADGQFDSRPAGDRFIPVGAVVGCRCPALVHGGTHVIPGWPLMITCPSPAAGSDTTRPRIYRT
jgi:hypothetical protein